MSTIYLFPSHGFRKSSFASADCVLLLLALEAVISIRRRKELQNEEVTPSSSLSPSDQSRPNDATPTENPSS